jgi:hypothetical protein
MSSPLTIHAGYVVVVQCSHGRSGRPHSRKPVLSIAKVANWLPEVSISTNSLAAHFKYIVVRSDMTINKLVRDHINGVTFGERRA